MGALSKSEPIFKKLNTHHSRLKSVLYAKFHANRMIYRDYMGVISKSEPIFTKLSTHHSIPNSLSCTKFRANRKVYRDFGAPNKLNRAKIYMGAISKSEPIFRKLNTHHSSLNSVLYAKFRANRKIFRYFSAPFTLNRMKIYI